MHVYDDAHYQYKFCSVHPQTLWDGYADARLTFDDCQAATYTGLRTWRLRAGGCLLLFARTRGCAIDASAAYWMSMGRLDVNSSVSPCRREGVDDEHTCANPLTKFHLTGSAKGKSGRGVSSRRGDVTGWQSAR